jgi:hypothetical protein
MREVRNDEGRLVCKIDEATGAITINIKGYVTVILLKPDGEIKVVNFKKTA